MLAHLVWKRREKQFEEILEEKCKKIHIKMRLHRWNLVSLKLCKDRGVVIAKGLKSIFFIFGHQIFLRKIHYLYRCTILLHCAKHPVFSYKQHTALGNVKLKTKKSKSNLILEGQWLNGLVIWSVTVLKFQSSSFEVQFENILASSNRHTNKFKSSMFIFTKSLNAKVQFYNWKRWIDLQF